MGREDGERVSGGGLRGNRGAPGFSGRVAVLVAVLAAAAGVTFGLLLVRGTAGTGAAAVTTPSASAPAPVPASLELLLTGRVLAVSGRSITIGGEGPSVTAAITGATKITGSIRVGDEISAQISGTPGHLTATSIEDS